MAANEYVFKVSSDTDRRTQEPRWRWALIRVHEAGGDTGSVKMRSAEPFKTREECEYDASLHRLAICDARVVLFPRA